MPRPLRPPIEMVGRDLSTAATAAAGRSSAAAAAVAVAEPVVVARLATVAAHGVAEAASSQHADRRHGDVGQPRAVLPVLLVVGFWGGSGAGRGRWGGREERPWGGFGWGGLAVEQGLRALQRPAGVHQPGIHRFQLFAGVSRLEIVLEVGELGGSVAKGLDRVGRGARQLRPISELDDQVRSDLDLAAHLLLALGLGDRRPGLLLLAGGPPSVEAEADQPDEGDHQHERQDAAARVASGAVRSRSARAVGSAGAAR